MELKLTKLKTCLDFSGHYKALFEELAKSDNFEVRDSISRNSHLNRATIYMLLKDTHQEVVRNVVCNSELTKTIEEEALEDVIKEDNIQVLNCIASNIDDFELCDRCKLAKRLSKHPNATVRASVLRWRGSQFVTTKTLQALAQDEDIDVASEAKAALAERGK